FEGRSSFKAFLLGIARNQFLMSLRSNKPRDNAVSITTFPEDSPSQLVASKEELRILAAALNATSPPFRQVLKMFYWDDLSVEEIARTLDVPAGTVKSRLGRGRSMIKARIIEAAGPSTTVARKLVEWMPPVDTENPKLGTEQPNLPPSATSRVARRAVEPHRALPHPQGHRGRRARLGAQPPPRRGPG